MSIDQSPKPTSKAGHRDSDSEQSASLGGWKIKERRSPAKSEAEKPRTKDSDQSGSSEARTTGSSERKLIIGASPSLKTERPAAPKARSLFSRLALPIALLLIVGAIMAAAIYSPFLGYFERLLGIDPTLDKSDQATPADRTNETSPITLAANQDLSVRAIALPALEDDGELLVYFRLPTPADWPIEITYETEARTAEADTDFAPTSGVVTIEPGEVLVEVSIPLIDDDVVESPEMFRVTLSVDPKAATMIDSQLTATVLDDDSRKQENNQ